MLVDSTSFAMAFAGGLLIGAATLVLLLGLGRVAGISGILGNALEMAGSGLGRFWRLAFLCGLVIAAPIAVAAGWGRVAPPLESNLLVLIVAGLLVGYGTRLGSGCTSGHAVCGLARFSKRSLVATAVFMASAAVVAFLRRHLLGG
ncbi:MAG TPA: YeeE/YedE thiosulfate transporter family protein [Terriglobales bacterium]|nr:YeeE/YedE thiosulfate transporter family protein [Terriglobales bacterium]